MCCESIPLLLGIKHEFVNRICILTHCFNKIVYGLFKVATPESYQSIVLQFILLIIDVFLLYDYF